MPKPKTETEPETGAETEPAAETAEAAPPPEGRHFVWSPRSAGAWLQTGPEEHWPAGSVIPEDAALDPDLDPATRALVEERPGAVEPGTPHERPWRQ